jgi:hypothetical protein
MRKIIVGVMVSMDGVMQSPGASNDPHHYRLWTVARSRQGTGA